MAWRTLPRNTPDMDTTKMDASRGTIRWDDHARRAARANGQSGAGRATTPPTDRGAQRFSDVVPSRWWPKAPRGGDTNWRPRLWLVPAFILMVVLWANYQGMRESWHWGGPGARHTEDIEPELRAAWDKICLTCWLTRNII